MSQSRWQCVFCKVEGWYTPSTHKGTHPAYDHDRPDGKRCVVAAKQGETAAAITDYYDRCHKVGVDSGD